MTASGAITLDNIQTEFGGANPISMSEYYRGGSYVPAHPGTTGIAASGTITVSSFYSTSRIWYVYVTIAANVADYNLATALGTTLGAAISTLSVPIYCYVTINSGVYCQSSSTLSYGFNVGTGWPASSYVQITNNGYITGKGGAGGHGGLTNAAGNAGWGGGDAIRLGNNTTIYNAGGYIQGGGGGGGGGGAVNTAGYTVGGGGGGGGASSPSYTSAGGAAGSASTRLGYNPAAGGAGGSSAGAGGAAGAVVWISGESSGTSYSGAGGAGGAYGAAGAAGTASTYGAGAAGAAGLAVSLAGYTVTWASGFNGTQVKGAVA
jgi:hypothetical protein